MTRSEKRPTEAMQDYIKNPPQPVTEQLAAQVRAEHTPLPLPLPGYPRLCCYP